MRAMARVAVFVLVMACGGRTDLSSGTATTDASSAVPEAGPLQFKVAYQDIITQGPVSAWHSRDQSTDTLPYPTLGAFTYDGARMAYADGNSVHVLDAHGQSVWDCPLPLPDVAYYPRVHPRPDGERLLVMGRAGEGAPEILAVGRDCVFQSAGVAGYDALYSPDGVTVLVTSQDTQNNVMLTTIFEDGSNATTLLASTETINGSPTFSWDGKRIVYGTSAGAVVYDLQAHTRTTYAREVITGDPMETSFTPDGTSLVFLALRPLPNLGLVSCVLRLDLTTSVVTTLVDYIGSQYSLEAHMSVAAE
jgi:hypothetical protein